MLGVAADEDIDAEDTRIPEARTGDKGSGLKDAWKDGILDSLPENATEAEKAKAFADQIIKDMQGMKSAKGLNGAYSKREDIIAYLDKKHNALFQDVFDCFHVEMRKFQEGEAA